MAKLSQLIPTSRRGLAKIVGSMIGVTIVAAPAVRLARAQITDTSLLELLNDGGPNNSAVLCLMQVFGDGSVAKGKLTFERKRSRNWRLVLTPSSLNLFHLLNSVGALIPINYSAIFDDGHHTTTAGWIGVHLPAYGTFQNDLRVRDTTWLVADKTAENPMWIDAR